MNLIPWRTTRDIPVTHESGLTTPIGQFRTEMDDLFDRFFHGTWPPARRWLGETEWTREFMPSIDVAENDKQITITAEIPGIDPDDVEINVTDNVLTLRGEKKQTIENKDEDHYHCERRFGSFTRSIELPPTADLDHVDAQARSGLLKVSIPKLATAKPKKVNVKKLAESAS